MRVKIRTKNIISIFLIMIVALILFNTQVYAEWKLKDCQNQEEIDKYNGYVDEGEDIYRYMTELSPEEKQTNAENYAVGKMEEEGYSTTSSKPESKEDPNKNANPYSDQYYNTLQDADEYVSFWGDERLKEFIKRVGSDQNFDVNNYSKGDMPGFNELQPIVNDQRDDLFEGIDVDMNETKERIRQLMGKLESDLNPSPNDADPDTDQDGNRIIYTLPDRNAVGAEKGEVGLDQAIEDSEKFLEGAADKYDDKKLKEFTASLYNIMLSLGVIAAISAGGVIGLKIMLGGLEAKAEAKQLLVPYVVGCVVVFGGFGIWKLIIEIFQQM